MHCNPSTNHHTISYSLELNLGLCTYWPTENVRVLHCALFEFSKWIFMDYIRVITPTFRLSIFSICDFQNGNGFSVGKNSGSNSISCKNLFMIHEFGMHLMFLFNNFTYGMCIVPTSHFTTNYCMYKPKPYFYIVHCSPEMSSLPTHFCFIKRWYCCCCCC